MSDSKTPSSKQEGTRTTAAAGAWRRTSRLTCRLRALRLPHREDVGTATRCSQGGTRGRPVSSLRLPQNDPAARCGALESSRSQSERRHT
jgi:hypothetical protein